MRFTWLFGGCFLLAVSFSACGPTLVHEQHYEFDGKWSYVDSVQFHYEITDTEKAYDLVLQVLHTDVYPTQNLYTRFVTVYPNGLRQSEPVSLELSDKFGQWLGDCAGERCELNIPLQQGAKYPENGTYALTIHQYGRQDSLQAISGIGLSIYEAEE